MTYLRRAAVMLVATAVMLSLCLFAAAVEQPSLVKAYRGQSYVAVKGHAGVENEGYDASLMLYKTNAAPDENSIGYIGQTTVDAKGDYSFEFTFRGFEYDADNQVSNYVAVLNVNGEKMNPTVTKASVISELVKFDLDFSNFGKALAELTNTYGLQNLKYKLIIGFYDETGRLLGAKMADKYTGDDPALAYSYSEIPEGTYSAKGFLWEDTDRLIPLADSQEFAIKAYTTERDVMCLTIAPGKTEAERNFAWYDLPGISDARLQFAEKTSDADLVTFPEDRAETVEGTWGPTTAVTEYNGIALSDGKDSVFKYEGDYTWAKAQISGLEAGKSYVYRLGDRLGWCKSIYEFKTDENPSEGFNFLLFADEHSTAGKAGQAITASREKALATIREKVGEPSLIFAMGDNVDLPWPEDAYVKYFDRAEMTSLPLAAVPGTTHDMLWNPHEASLFGYHFNMPNQSETSGYAENVGGNYWYTYGDVLFIGIMHNGDSEAEIATTKAFVEEATQANPNAKWRILCTHFPFYSMGTEGKFFKDGSDFLDDCDIDIVFSGHMHWAFRTHQMKGGAIAEDTTGLSSVTDPEGVVYVSLNTTGFRAETYPKQESSMVFSDEDVVSYYSTTSETEGYYHTNFTTAEVITTDSECSLSLVTYKNTHDRETAEITDTQVIDSYKITKTN